MSITDELREYVQSWRENPNLMDGLDAGDVDGILADFECIADRIDAEHERAVIRVNDSDKVLTYEDAKQLCMKAFDGGATYGSESMRYGVNARAYDWDHWLEKNKRLFKPEPTVEDVLREFANECLTYATCVDDHEVADAIELYAAKLRLAKEDA